MSNRKISPDSLNAISSPESEAGAEHCNSQDGDQIDLFGQVLHHVSHSQTLDKNKEEATSGISGHLFSSSSGSANLQLSLWSKLQHLSKADGLMKSRRIWKQNTTPSGRLFSQLVVSGHYIEDQDCGLWPTPIHSDGRGSAGVGKQELPNITKLAIWPTVTTQDNIQVQGERSASSNSKRGTTLGGAARLTTTFNLLGEAQNQSNAEMVESDLSLLNPNFSLWLMGYPQEWGRCAERVTASFRKRRRKS